MSREKFSDHCEGCRPALMEMATQALLPPEHPGMIAINKWWNTRTTYHQRKAWHAVTCLNSRMPSHVRIASEMADKMGELLKASMP